MPTSRACVLALVAGATLAGCSRAGEQAAPVATPTVTLSRATAAAGSPLDVTYRFDVAQDAPPFTGEYTVFVHFLDADGEQLWTDDHEPPTPVRQWTPGATVEYTRTMFVPTFPHTGETHVEVGLYAPASGDRLPLAGDDRGLRAYRVASFTMSPQSENLFVIFKDGWHPTEVGSDGDLEWQWSTREGTIAFRNPRQDAELYLQVDQAVDAFAEPQQVEVRLGSTVLDSFSLPSGVRTLRRFTLPAGAAGDAETVELTIAVDKTFVPSDVPALGSSDDRELGIRVFRAYLEPK